MGQWALSLSVTLQPSHMSTTFTRRGTRVPIFVYVWVSVEIQVRGPSRVPTCSQTAHQCDDDKKGHTYTSFPPASASV